MVSLHYPRLIVAFVAITVVAAVIPIQTTSSHTPPEVAAIGDGNHLQLAVELYSEVFNDRKAVGAERLIAGDAIIHTPHGDFIGPAGLLAYLDGIHRVYPDARYEITAIDVEGDTIVVQWTMTATRLQLDPSYGPIFAMVSSPGETTITVAGGQVASLNQAERRTAVQPAEEITTARSASPVR